MVYDIISRTEPVCEMFVFEDRARAEAKYAELVALRGEGLVKTNFAYLEDASQ